MTCKYAKAVKKANEQKRKMKKRHKKKNGSKKSIENHKSTLSQILCKVSRYRENLILPRKWTQLKISKTCTCKEI